MAYYNPNSLWDLLETLASQQNDQQQSSRQQRQQPDEDEDYDDQDFANFFFRPPPQAPYQRPPPPRSFPYGPAAVPSRKASSALNNGRRPVPPPKPAQFQRPKSQTQRILPFAINPNAFLPPIDVYDSPEAYHVFVSVPGARKNTTEVHFNPETSQLFIEGEVNEPEVAVNGAASAGKKATTTLLLSERETGPFGRVLHLPSEPKIDEDGITAKFKAGVLEVVVPKQTGAHVVKRKIQIEDVDDDELVAEAKGE
jgi:HSP20 family protein